MKKLISNNAGALFRNCLMLLAVLAGAFYIFFLADDRYVSQSRFTVKSESDQGASMLDLGMLGASSSTKQDQLIIRDFIFSEGVMLRLLNEFGHGYLTSSPRDLLWHLPQTGDTLVLAQRVADMIEYTFDDEASISTLRVQGFDSETATRVNRWLLDISIDFINDFSEKMARRSLELAEAEVAKAKERLDAAMDHLQYTQDMEGLLQPEMDMEVATQTLAALEGQLATARVNLAINLETVPHDSPIILRQQREVEHLEKHLAQRREALVGVGGDARRMSGKNRAFMEADAELKFATEAYIATLRVKEAANLKVLKDQKTLMVVAEPSQPTVAELPARWIDLAILLLLVVVLRVLAMALIAVLRDNS